jgi:hypothetical protein
MNHAYKGENMKTVLFKERLTGMKAHSLGRRQQVLEVYEGRF